MDSNTGYVKGQKVMTPSGDGFVENIEGDPDNRKASIGTG